MDFSNMTNLRELLAAGGPILILLLLLSVYSISIILERFFKLRSTISLSRKLMAYCRHPLRSENYQKVEDACRKEVVKNTPAAALILRLVQERNRPQAELEKIADSVIDWEVTKLQRRLTILGTLGSITPFIGLFGTVIGVMHAFKDLAANTATSAGASVVAAGIAEALVNTAAGLFVAVPAVIAYNYYLSKTNYFAKELENIADEIIYRRGDVEEF
ncbi:MotA/TolQ/ExbB proton channel family protein [Candidatus Avelusimicrobium fimicolum]|uniref:MotA/TolQ/ExbB proton channel family protein n=1 Tax=Candidatus Avelusimicrobium fimicolum TaxID=3416216 RepID=UPI000EC612D5|nr:MotA/TolQ/ExbB proton channel family protein [Spirochaetia bacterium]HAM42304.1 tolQ protein [Elusimicrobiota bacterium]